jgi:hypothetical protein
VGANVKGTWGIPLWKDAGDYRLWEKGNGRTDRHFLKRRLVKDLRHASRLFAAAGRSKSLGSAVGALQPRDLPSASDALALARQRLSPLWLCQSAGTTPARTFA